MNFFSCGDVFVGARFGAGVSHGVIPRLCEDRCTVPEDSTALIPRLSFSPIHCSSTVFSLVSFLKRKNEVGLQYRHVLCVYMCVCHTLFMYSFQLSSQPTDFHKTGVNITLPAVDLFHTTDRTSDAKTCEASLTLVSESCSIIHLARICNFYRI